MAPVTIPDQRRFVREWNALDRPARRRVRRLVRVGRALETPEEAALAVAYARFQQSRMWWRFFWVWFVPGVVLALGVATQIHPVVIGVVLAFAAQAVLVRRNVARVEQVNAELLGRS